MTNTYDLEIVNVTDAGETQDWTCQLKGRSTGQAIREAKDAARARARTLRTGVTWALSIAGRLVAHDVIPLVERTRKDETGCVGCFGANDICECPVALVGCDESAEPECSGDELPEIEICDAMEEDGRMIVFEGATGASVY